MSCPARCTTLLLCKLLEALWYLVLENQLCELCVLIQVRLHSIHQAVVVVPSDQNAFWPCAFGITDGFLW